MAKLTPQLVQSIHALDAQKLSGRTIAHQLGCSEATVRRGLKLDPTPAPRPLPPARRPILLSYPVNDPAPCPETAPPWCSRLYGSLLQRDLFSELDALIVFADLPAERTHLCLDVFSTDVLLGRIASLPEPIDMTAGIDRLRDAFAWDDRLRQWCRDVAGEAGA
jgi:hypothetical protein